MLIELYPPSQDEIQIIKKFRPLLFPFFLINVLDENDPESFDVSSHITLVLTNELNFSRFLGSPVFCIKCMLKKFMHRW